MQHILDAHAEAPRQVNARLGGDDRVLGHGLVVVRRGVRRFVDLQTETVTEAMAEIRAIPRVCDDAAGRAVDGQIECFLGVLREMESLRTDRTRCRK